MLPPFDENGAQGAGVRGSRTRPAPARRARALVAIGLLVLQLTGCFSYVPVGYAAPDQGAELSVALTDQGRIDLAERIGPGVRRLGGDLLEHTDSSLILGVQSVEYMDLGVTARWQGERVEVGHRLISEVGERRLSRSRTGVLAGLIAVAAVAASYIVIEGSAGEPGPGRPPEPGDPE